MKLSTKEIQSLYEQYRTPKNVIEHMIRVAEFAKELAEKLIKKGHKIDLEKLEKAALLHDLLRVCDFRELELSKLTQRVTSVDIKAWLQQRKLFGKMGHTKAAHKILKELGHTKIAELILKHDFKAIDELQTWEEKILYYADKRVDGGKKVSLRKRFKSGKKRNSKPGDNANKIKELEKKVYALEKELKKATKAL